MTTLWTWRRRKKKLMDTLISNAHTLFYRIYAPQHNNIELAFVAGGTVLGCIDKLSDIDIVFVTTQSNAEKSFKALCGDRLYSFLGNPNNNWSDYARIQCWFVEPRHVLWATEEGMRQLEHYKSQACLVASEYCNKHQDWIDDFLNKGVFRKELYHLVYCHQLAANQSIPDRALLLDIKRGRANELLRQLLLDW